MKFKTLALLLAVGSLGAAEPLANSAAYTLEMAPDLSNRQYLFPIGVLGDHGFRTIPYMGLNLTERSHCDYAFREGKPSTYKASETRNGINFFNIWAAHSLYRSRETKNYGTLKNSMSADGKSHGRHQLNVFDPQTRKYVGDAARRTVGEVLKVDSPAVYIWGIDNEWELPVDYSPEAMQEFHKWLEKEYNGDLSMLNRAWKADYKSFGEAVPPSVEDSRKRPGAWLNFRRFQELAYADFIADYFRAIQDADPEKRPVISKSTQCTLEMQAVARKRSMNHELLADATRELGRGWYGIDQYGHNDRNIYELNYLYNCIRPTDPTDKKFRPGIFYGETNNHAGPGWQFAQTYWRTLSNGAKGIEFFVMGSHGGAADYATFGMTYSDGIRRDRFYYLSRLASLIHRSEKFWYEAAPAENLPRLAMLMPQRDVQLSADTGVSWWDYSNNNRLSVFGHLRNMGYWVDVIPYGKLDPKFLSHYQGLVLVDAEHLSKTECDNIKSFVADGGVLLADMRAGNFNEHHLETAGLAEVLGLKYKGVYSGIEVSPDDLWYNTEYGNVIRADGKILADLTTATLLNADDVFNNAKGAWITLNTFGKGKAMWFNTRLGALRPESVEPKVVSKWFGKQLETAGLAPAYSSNNGNTEKMRVELPVVDAQGNCAIIIAGCTREALPQGKLTVAIPAGDYKSAFWSAAEGAKLEKLDFVARGNQLTFNMPEIKTAGVIYLFPAGPPMLGLIIEGLKDTAQNDPYTYKAKPGQSFQVTVQLVNPSNQEMTGGEVKLQALQDWTIGKPERTVRNIPSGKILKYEFKVTVPEDKGQFTPEFIYPLVASFEKDGKRLAVNNAIVTMEVDRTRYEHLLSDNTTRGSLYRLFGIRTKATSLLEAPDTIVYDLNDEYALTRVQARNGNSQDMTVSVSRDGKEYMPFQPEAKGRYVKITMTFKDGKNARIGEVEIYGKPLK